MRSLLNVIRERRANLLDAMGRGGAKDYAAYREMCGELKGLAEAETMLADYIDAKELGDD